MSVTVDRTFGVEGEPCTACHAPLAADQRYCLACGVRRHGLHAVWAQPAPAAPPLPAAAPSGTVASARWAPGWRPDAGAAAGIGCLLLAMLIGVLIGRSGDRAAPMRASAPQVISVGGAPTSTDATATAPATKRKGKASSKSAKADKVKAPSRATVAKSKAALDSLSNATSPADYAKKSAKLPKTLVTPGKLPPKDTSKPAGAGSDTQEFK
jgi:hypothetical protein